MSLTVPTSNRVPGPAAQVRVEADTAGAQGAADLGQVLTRIGDSIVADRLQRDAARRQVDFTRDLGALRLEVEQETDPDAIDTRWSEGQAELRQRYAGEGADPRIRPELETRFDELANRHGFALGQRAIAARHSQREATWIGYRHEIVGQAATADPETRDELLDGGLQQIDALEAQGTISPEEAAKRRVELIGDTDNARAIHLAGTDPQGFLEAQAAGEFTGLEASTAARMKVQAQAAVERQAELATKERAAVLADHLDDVIDVLGAGRDPVVDETLLADPAAQEAIRRDPALAAKVGRARAAAELRRDQPEIARLTPDELDTLIAEERQKPIVKKWQDERLQVLEAARREAIEGWKADPIAFARRVDLKPPELPAPGEDGYAEGLAARLRFSDWLVERGYVDEARVLDETEAAALVEATGVEADAAARAEVAGQLAGTLAERRDVLARVAPDPVFRHAGGLVAARGDTRLAEEVFRGQQAIEAGTIVMPPAAERVTETFAEVESLFADLPGGEAQLEQVTAAADALYAARRRREDPGEGQIDGDLYRQALHEVLGGSRDGTRGGVQDVRGRATLLPAYAGAEDVEQAFDRLGLAPVADRTRTDGTPVMRFDEAAFTAQLQRLGGGVPVLHGEPLTWRDMRDLQLRAVADGTYTLIYPTRTGDTALNGEDGSEWTFRLSDLLAETRGGRR